jgi:hypothetical protein
MLAVTDVSSVNDNALLMLVNDNALLMLAVTVRI